jgi:hypothetical protein
MRKSIILLAMSVTVAAAVALGISRLEVSERDLSEAPPREATDPSLPAGPSSVQVSAVVSTAALTEGLDRAIPDSHRIEGTKSICSNTGDSVRDTVGQAVGGELGKRLGEFAGRVADDTMQTRFKEMCHNVNYAVTLVKTGNPEVRSSDQGLVILLPIGAEGDIGLPGELARILGLNKKSFRGALNALIDISLDITSDWCPEISAKVDFQWTENAQFEILDGWWIDIDRPAGAVLRRQIDKAIKDIDQKIGCDDIRNAVAPKWHQYNIALPLPEVGADAAHLTVRPTGAGYSGISYRPDSIAAAIQLDAMTEVIAGPAPADPGPLPLPPLERIDVSARHVDIHLPIRLGYDELDKELNRVFAGKTFTGNLPTGAAKVTIDRVTVYPSGNRLVAGLHFKANLDTRLLDVAGWAYLAARPVLSEDKQTIKLEDVSLTREVDNDLWSLLSDVFNTQIVAEIERSAVFDLEKPITEATAQLQKAVADFKEKSGIDISLENPEITLIAVAPAAQALEAVARFRTEAAVSVLSLK